MNRLAHALNVQVFAFDYRGYGRSEGKPDEAGVLADGEAALEWLADYSGRPPQDTILLGRSLGGAVAVHLAAKYQARALILQSTFSRLTDVAASHYPIFPVRLLMRNRYDSLARIANYSNPLLQIHGDQDDVVPLHFGQTLYEAAPSPDKQLLTLPGRGHNDISIAEYTDNVAQFLNRLLDPTVNDRPLEGS